MSEQDNVELKYSIKDPEFGVEAIAVTCRGWKHEKIGCQDSSTVYQTQNKTYCALICSDGHSSAKYGREGADAICTVLCEILDEFEKKEALEEDVIRYLRGRFGRRDILRRWLGKITKKEETRSDSMLIMEGNKRIAKAYGATLNAFILTENYIVSISIGDGALVGVRPDGRFCSVFVDEEDGVSTGRTLSLCNLNSEYLNIAVSARNKFRYLIALTDGYTKTYDLFDQDSALAQIVEIYKESGWEQTRTDILEFMRSEDIVTINDDVSLMFAALSEKHRNSCSLAAVNTKNSFFYDDFTAVFPQMGEAEVGVYSVLSEKDIFRAASVVTEAVKELDREGIVISNPVDEALLFDQKTHEFSMVSSLLYNQKQEQEIKNIYLHPELQAGMETGEIQMNHVYLAGMLLKLFERERLCPFLLYQEWIDKKDIHFEKENAQFLDEEILCFLEKLYNGLCEPEEIWTPEKWEWKISNLKKERERKEREAERKRKEEHILKLEQELETANGLFRENQKEYLREKELLEQEQKNCAEEWAGFNEKLKKLRMREIELHNKERQLQEKINDLEAKEKELASEEKKLSVKQNEISEKKRKLEEKQQEESCLEDLENQQFQKENQEESFLEKNETENELWGTTFFR